MVVEHGAKVRHHVLMLTLLAIKPPQDMLKRSLLLIHAILNSLKSMLQTLELIGEASLIMIHAILHGVELGIIDYYKFLHVSAEKANLSR